MLSLSDHESPPRDDDSHWKVHHRPPVMLDFLVKSLTIRPEPESSETAGTRGGTSAAARGACGPNQPGPGSRLPLHAQGALHRPPAEELPGRGQGLRGETPKSLLQAPPAGSNGSVSQPRLPRVVRTSAKRPTTMNRSHCRPFRRSHVPERQTRGTPPLVSNHIDPARTTRRGCAHALRGARLGPTSTRLARRADDPTRERVAASQGRSAVPELEGIAQRNAR